jgi:hypothetical protein
VVAAKLLVVAMVTARKDELGNDEWTMKINSNSTVRRWIKSLGR